MNDYRIAKHGDVAKRDIRATGGFSRLILEKFIKKPFSKGLFLVLACFMLVVPVFPQEEVTNPIRKLAAILSGVEYDVVEISDDSQKACAIAEYFNQGKFSKEEQVWIFGHKASETPISPGALKLHRASMTASLGLEIKSATETKYGGGNNELYGLGTADYQRLIEIVSSQAVVLTQRVQLEIFVSARHKENGSGRYLCLTWVSAQVPSADMLAKFAAVSTNCTFGSTTPPKPATLPTAEEKLALVETVRKLFDEDPEFQKMNERFDKYFD